LTDDVVGDDAVVKNAVSDHSGPSYRIDVTCHLAVMALIMLVTGAAAAERDVEWYKASYRSLALKAAERSLPHLYYPTSTFTPHHWALMKMRDPLVQDVLVALYGSDANERSRWNYLVIMINRERKHGQPDPVQAILGCCIAGVQAKDEWLKTESIWGVGFYGDESHIELIMDARNDLSDVVAEEADRTIRKLRSRPVR